MAVIDRVHELATPAVEAADATLYDIEFNGGVLRLLIDREGGIDIDVIKRISRDVSRVLDEADPIPGRYTLEVSSPGLERPLRTPTHYAGAVGELAKFKLFAELDGRRRFEGTITAADDETVSIDTPDGAAQLPLDQIAKARTVFVWGPSPKPGGPKAKPPEPSDSPEATDQPEHSIQPDLSNKESTAS